MFKRYIRIYPTFPFLYPCSEAESKEVYNIMKKRTVEDEHFFYDTDESVTVEFKKWVPETNEQLNEMLDPYDYILYSLKYLINRPRPEQVNEDVKQNKLHTYTGITPAYPSGHTLQAFILAHKLSEKYPSRKKELFDLAEKCGRARINAGVHYPSDHEFSKKLSSWLA